MSDKIIIGVTDCSKFDIYSDWVLSYNENVQVIQLGYKLNNFEEIEKCHGIVLTGGEDVHPRFYNMPEYFPYCYEDDIDEIFAEINRERHADFGRAIETLDE